MEQRAKEPTFAVARILLLLGLASVGCSAPPQGGTTFDAPASEAKEQPPLDPLRAGASVVCDVPEGGALGGAAIYMLAAMNHKLRYYPEFATAIGVDLVKDCESGHRFMLGYGDYLAEHPGFDADEPAAPSPDDDEPMPPIEPDEPGETMKIGGTTDAVTNNPVVEIKFTTCTHRNCPNAGGLEAPEQERWITASGDLRRETFQCSGTFISKNWILTSAHCLTAAAIDSCMEAGVTRNNCTPDWPQWGQWSIRGTLTTSIGTDNLVGTADDVHRSYTVDRVWARGYVPDNWLGTERTRNKLICDTPALCFDADASADHDVALLYIRSENDDKLAPRVEWDGAKRLAIAGPRPSSPFTDHDPSNDWQIAIYGWGQPGPIGTRPMKTRSGPLVGGAFENPSIKFDRIDFDVTASAANTNPAYICEGDSGGPLVRVAPTLQTNVGQQSNVQLVVGVLSSVEGAGVPPTCSATALTSGTRLFWHATRVDKGENRDFIEKTIKRWTNTRFFNCLEKPITTGGRVEFEECFGPPCSAPGGLPDGCAAATDQCWSPARTVAASHSSCKACDGFTGALAGCGCILGQCLPTK